MRNVFGIFIFINIFTLHCLYSQDELISNGDFEVRAIAPWTMPAWQANLLLPQIDRAVFQGPGNASLRFTGEAGKRAFVMQRIKLDPKMKKLKFGGWMKTDGMQNHWVASITLECVVKNSGKESYKYFSLVTSWQLFMNPWTKYESTVEVPENTQYVGIILQTVSPDGKLERSNTGTVWFDNIFLEEASE